MKSEEPLRALAVLADPTRNALYCFVRRARMPVTREQAADAVGISRKLAAFHLDKLVAARLLEAQAHRPRPVRMGRAPKAYRPSDTAWQVAVPHRDYRALAEVLSEAIISGSGEGDPRDSAVAIAARRGGEQGVAHRLATRPGRLGAERALTLLDDLLQAAGYEPYRPGPGRLRLGNCPYHELAAIAPDLVCALNHAQLSGLLDGLQVRTVQACAAPAPGDCCVELRAGH